MCIIITKTKGAKPLPTKCFENAWDNNPDGAGILFNDGKTTTLIKGIMERKEFLKKVKLANKKECSFIIHTRIATHGSIKPENTHPFVSKTLGFAHNGTMNIKPLEDKTDSESFFVWTIADKTFKWCQENKFLLDLATDGSRCVIFDMTTGDMLHLCEEDWLKDKKYPGYMFSNKSYETTYTRYVNWPSPASNNGMGTAALEDDYYYKKYKKAGCETNLLDSYEADNIDNITSEMLKRDKKGNWICDENWVTSYLSVYAEKTFTELDKKEMADTLWRMGTSLQDAEMFDGKYQLSTQALSIAYSFYKIASHKGYKKERQVNECFKDFIKSIVCQTPEDEDLVKELEYIREEWR